MALEKYTIRQIDYRTAMELIVREHYLHRKAPCSVAFGLFLTSDKGFLNDELKGVVCYGTPSSSTLKTSIAGVENSFNVIELTRLWVCDSVPRNGESFLIGNTLKKCGKEIVVSYADSGQQHLGIVYQATNWIYTGLSAQGITRTVTGLRKQTFQSRGDNLTIAELREKYGDRLTIGKRTRKHRYVFINAKGRRKVELLAALKYKQQPYPKGANAPHEGPGAASSRTVPLDAVVGPRIGEEE